MQIIKTPSALAGQSYAATIGFFDGVHRGHRFLIAALRELAGRKGLLSMALTFPEHPRNVLKDGHIPAILTTFDEKMRLLEATGIDACLLVDFTPQLAALSAHDFITKVLAQWGVKALLVGYDHRFGHNRSDGFEQYAEYGRECGIEVVRAEACDSGERTVSSSMIRKLLAAGEVEQAAQLLTCPYRLTGRVVHGNGIGHTIGFPTANITPDDARKLIPAPGVYAVTTHVDGEYFKGMLSIGNRPTFNSITMSIEVHILNFGSSIYGQTIEVEFIKRLRDNIRFDSLDALRVQLENDLKKING